MKRLAFLLLLCACTRTPRSRCDQVCAKQAECSDKLDQPFDAAECVEQCKLLDRAAQSQKLVDEHVRCVEAAKSCEVLVDCP